MGTELCHADRQTYTPKLTVAFRNSANAEGKLIKHFYDDRWRTKSDLLFSVETKYVCNLPLNQGQENLTRQNIVLLSE